MTDSLSLPPRDRILRTAHSVFYADGLRVGIDRIIAEAGVAKASFYRYFPAKDDLVQAFLEARHEHWMTWFTERVEALVAERGPGLALVAAALGEWFAEPTFRGCAFINASADGGITPACMSVVQRHKADLLACLAELAQRAGNAAPAQAAEEALLIVEGAIVRAQMTGDPSVAVIAGRMLAQLDGRETKPD